MLDIAVIEDPKAAEASLDPIRSALLAELRVPASAAALAARLGLPRQKVNYHLKALEHHGLVELVEERRKGNVTERIMAAAAGSFVISPAALSAVAPDPEVSRDRFSARWMLAVAAKLVRDVGTLVVGSAAARKPLATFALDGEITFATAADRAAFVQELGDAVASLAAKYHSGTAAGGRRHRIVVALHPSVIVPRSALSSAVEMSAMEIRAAKNSTAENSAAENAAPSETAGAAGPSKEQDHGQGI